jgi:hypothetical protein
MAGLMYSCLAPLRFVIFISFGMMTLEKSAYPGFVEKHSAEDFIPALKRRDHPHPGAEALNGVGGNVNDAKLRIWIFEHHTA